MNSLSTKALLLFLVLSAGLTGWVLLERRDAQSAAQRRVWLHAADAIRGLELMREAAHQEEPNWGAFYEGFIITVEAARNAGAGPVLSRASGTPREAGLRLHGLSYYLADRYQQPARRMANGNASNEDQRRTLHLAGTINRIGLPEPPYEQWALFANWQRRLQAALPPTFPTPHLDRLSDMVPDEAKIDIDADTIAVIRFPNGPLNFDPATVYVSVIHVPSWSLFNVNQQGDVTYEGVFSQTAMETFKRVRADAKLMGRMARLAGEARDPLEAWGLARA